MVERRHSNMASRLVPTPQQLAWQQMEFTCFLHFGINTFTGREWGDGKEDPAIFNPTELDCEQWVRALKEGGFKMAIIIFLSNRYCVLFFLFFILLF